MEFFHWFTSISSDLVKIIATLCYLLLARFKHYQIVYVYKMAVHKIIYIYLCLLVEEISQSRITALLASYSLNIWVMYHRQSFAVIYLHQRPCLLLKNSISSKCEARSSIAIHTFIRHYIFRSGMYIYVGKLNSQIILRH